MIRAVCYGLGEIGLAVARVAIRDPHIDVVGAIDIAPDKAGQPLGELAGEASDVVVSDEANATLEATNPDVVLLATSSRMDVVTGQILECLGVGAAVVTSSEELAYPWGRREAEEIDRAAKQANRAVLGTGVNPGFVMDFLPIVLARASASVQRVSIRRAVDLTRRRQALQEKAGVGMAVAQFERLAVEDAIGHVGLDSSLRLVARAFGVADVTEAIELKALVDEQETVYGFEQRTARTATENSPAIELALVMSMRLEEPEADTIWIEGEPPTRTVIEGGVFGDTATAALMVNAVPQVMGAAPGLKTVLDMPLAQGW